MYYPPPPHRESYAPSAHSQRPSRAPLPERPQPVHDLTPLPIVDPSADTSRFVLASGFDRHSSGASGEPSPMGTDGTPGSGTPGAEQMGKLEAALSALYESMDSSALQLQADLRATTQPFAPLEDAPGVPGDKQDGAHESVDGGDTADDDRSAERPVATSRHTQLPRIDGEGSADVGIVRRESVEHVLIRPSGGGHAGGGSSDVSDRASVGTTNSVHTMFGFDAEDGPPVDSRSGGASAGSIGSAGGASVAGGSSVQPSADTSRHGSQQNSRRSSRHGSRHGSANPSPSYGPTSANHPPPALSMPPPEYAAVHVGRDRTVYPNDPSAAEAEAVTSLDWASVPPSLGQGHANAYSYRSTSVESIESIDSTATSAERVGPPSTPPWPPSTPPWPPSTPPWPPPPHPPPSYGPMAGYPSESFYAPGRTSPASCAVDEVADGAGGREAATRKPWQASEDQLIIDSVTAMGFKWRAIAGVLPGRSDDAVRNRWNRLQEAIRDGTRLLHGPGQEKPKAGYKCSKCGQPKRNHVCTYQPGTPLASELANARQSGKAGMGGVGGGLVGCGGSGRVSEEKVRVSWTKHEDDTIRVSVNSLGPRWSLIAAKLPGRTEHAVRNRWHRLQNLDAADGSAIAGLLLPADGGDEDGYAPTQLAPEYYHAQGSCPPPHLQTDFTYAPYPYDPLQPHHEMYLPQLPHAVPLAVGEAVLPREASDKRALNKTR